ncbi:glycosyltransferase [Lutibacter sp. A80]|uniref:glycosyltransferase n=1 Tax=Lutibacter sp. A80 TaxID=2918453 RepID=UPI001F0513F0|nr:glycosyltransferase [Lutibacter sp. A80]UMB60337.1 glycosyltransferase [Lutibacter sp. A80]
MKKNILFIIPSLDAGGAEKSLINLLSVFDYSKYNVDLVLFNKTGLFLNMLPKEVSIIEIKGDYTDFVLPLKESILQFIKQFKFRLVFNRLLFTFKNKFIKNKALAEQYSWKNMSTVIPKSDKKYDTAIAFLEKSSIYFLVDKIEANKKIGFIHNDYNKLDLNKEFDNFYFTKLNYLVTVSEECLSVLKFIFPKLKQKIKTIHNIVSTELISQLAESDAANEMIIGKYNILSIGRLHPQKGFDMAVDACGIIKRKGYNLNWYIIGEGNERENLEIKIKEKELVENFYLLGLKENPYPFIKKADVFVQSSKYEGKSIVIDEAKILNKPIVTTNYSTVKDQIQHNINGLVVEINAESLANGIIKMIMDKDLRESLVFNLNKENLGTEHEINNLYNLIEY